MESFLDALFEGGNVQQKEPDTYLFHVGDPVRFVHLIEEGAVHLERTQVNGQVMCFQRAHPGDVIAEASIYAEAYHCDARLVERARLRRLSIERLIKRLEADPELSRAWQARLARTVQTIRLLAEIRGLKKVEQRLDAWIDHNGTLPAKGQWQDVAQELAVTPEAFYREIARRRTLKASSTLD
ncbi:Crp/Fnr family transcriptional regulator [uncultured Roseobacter sp.]|uniref:Crp/Fnr family transcriptional regulator n=1 Tax=uncultured Roseobacter sp. TaxID=114847 RepID=UPI002626B3A8|nr:Crp/Fnr family transcriptional regulator [uncultured Roseobacter sp.]